MSDKVFNIDFMGYRKPAAILSVVLVVGACVSMLIQGLNLGLDFTGGTLVEVEFVEATDPQEIRQMLEGAGYANGVVQFFGTNRDLLIRMPPQSGVDQSVLGDRILASLRETYPGIVMRQSNYVGPAVGEELTEDAGLALLAALAMIMLYILFRFTKQFAVGAVAALVHDVLLVLGIFSLFRWTFDLSVLAAVLAVIGYSLNDTIVVSDRIRENFRNIRKGEPIGIINTSLNQTLGRTLVTSLTTLFVLLALLITGGEIIRGFAAALTIGVVVGTYSSVYVASNVLLLLNITREDLLLPVKDDVDEQALP
jgi:preprotein translocase subunit SecF